MSAIGWVDADNPVLGQIDAAAERYGVDPNLAHAVAQIESGYNPKAVSPVGAGGVMQLMPATAKQYGVTNLFDPAQNIDAGVRLLRDLSKRYGSDNVPYILAGYNAGPGAVSKYGGVPPYKETQNYVAKGMSILGSAPPTAAAAPDIGWEDAAPATDSPATLTLQGATIPAPPSVASLGLKSPPTEPPGTPAPPEEKNAIGFINNLGTSAYNNLISPVVHPYQTLSGISNLLEGIHELGGGMPVPGMQGRQAVQGLTDLYKQRYGSIEGFKNAFYKDPVGILSDLVTVASAGGVGVGAAQDFIRAAGLTDAALAAKNTFADAVASAAKGPQAAGAFFKGAAEAVPEAAKSAVNRGIDLSLGGPHAMVLGAKAQFGKQILQAGIRAMKEAWAGAPEAPEAAAEAAPAAASATAPSPAPAAAPAAAAATATPGQAYAATQGVDWASLSATDRQVMEQIAQAHANVAAQTPPVTPPRPAPQAAPVAPEAPAPPPAAAPVSEAFKPGDVVQWRSQGVDQFTEPRAIRGFSPDGKYAFVEGTNTGLPVEQLTRAEAPPTPPAGPSAGGAASRPGISTFIRDVTPTRLTKLEDIEPPPSAPAGGTGLGQLGEMGQAITGNMYQMLWDKVLKGDVTEAGAPSAVLQVAKAVRSRGGLQTIDDLRALSNDFANIPRGPQFQNGMRALVDKYSPAGSGYSLPVAPEPAAPPASASSAAQALYDELKRSGTLEPEPAPAEKPAFEQRARDAKVDKLYELITTKKIPQDWVARFTPESWRILAHEVGVPEPSAATIRQLKARLADYYRPQMLPATTPAEAQAAFDAARARVQ